MSPELFNQRVAALKSRSSLLPAARSVLVDGVPYHKAANSFSVDIGALHRLCARIQFMDICDCCGQEIR